MGKILIDDCVDREKYRKYSGKHREIYSKLIDLLKEGFSSGNSSLVTISEYGNMNAEEREDLWKSLDALFIHTDSSGYTSLLTRACKAGIPVIMVRGKEIDAPWSIALQEAGLADLRPSQLGLTDRLFYPLKETHEVRGAVRWITDYYYPLKKRVAELAKQEANNGQKRAEEAVRKAFFTSIP